MQFGTIITKKIFNSLQIDHSLNTSLADSAQFIFAYQDVFESRHVQRFDPNNQLELLTDKKTLMCIA